MAAETKELPNLLAKIVVVGDSGTGKTCIVNRYSKGSYPTKAKPTVSIDFTLKTVRVHKRSVTLQIWDTAGQERFRSVTTSFFQGAQASVIVFDLTHRESFSNLDYWLKTVKEIQNSFNSLILVIVGNKVDEEDEREVRQEEAEEWCRRNGNLLYFETSAKDNINLEKVFFSVARELVKLETRGSEEANTDSRRKVEDVDTDENQQGDNRCAC